MTKPFWKSKTIANTVQAIAANALTIYVSLAPENITIAGIAVKKSAVLGLLGAFGIERGVRAIGGRLDAKDVLCSPPGLPGFNPDVALKIEADHAIAAATAIGIPTQIAPQIASAIQTTQPPTAPISQLVQPFVDPGFQTITIDSTTAKQGVVPASELDDKHKVGLAAGTYSVQKIGDLVAGHWNVSFTRPVKGFTTWRIWEGAITAGKPSAPIKIAPQTVTSSNPLSVPYYSQRDNAEQWWRTCNTSTHAMLIEYLKPGVIKGDDDYYRRFVKPRGDTVDHTVHTAALLELGIESTWEYNLTYADLDKQLALGLPVPIGVLHNGTIHRPEGGHIILVIGKTADGYICHDPWGEGFGANYEINHDGEAVVYPKSSLDVRWVPGEGWGRIVAAKHSPKK